MSTNTAGSSTLRDTREREHMEMAIELADRCVNEPGKISPKVGAVVVRDAIE
jgi:pyrimidine deaminase RibD-like protein